MVLISVMAVRFVLLYGLSMEIAALGGLDSGTGQR